MSHRLNHHLGAGGRERRPEACATWALLLVDAAEGLLSEAEQSVVDRHLSGCTGCSEELAAAQRGAAWLGLLKEHAPEPPPALLNNILAKTTGASSAVVPSPLGLDPVAGPTWLPAGSGRPADGSWSRGFGIASADGRTLNPGERFGGWFGTEVSYVPALQPRLAMASAMAFFSICLTLNLLGVSVHSLRVDAFRPAGIQRTVADTGASLVRSFEGIRVVYRVEARVNEWRTANVADDAPPLETR